MILFFPVSSCGVFLSLKMKQSCGLTSQRKDSDDRFGELVGFIILV